MLGTPVKCYAVVPDADNRRIWAMAILEVRTLYGHWNVRELDHVNTYNPWLNSSATNVRHWQSLVLSPSRVKSVGICRDTVCNFRKMECVQMWSKQLIWNIHQEAI